MKKSLFAMFMAGCLLASCNNDEPNPNAGTGELETSYIAVSVNSANASTRADADDFEQGNTSEQKVSTAHFFFFDASGNPFNLNSASLVGESDKANYVVKTIHKEEKYEKQNEKNIGDYAYNHNDYELVWLFCDYG